MSTLFGAFCILGLVQFVGWLLFFCDGDFGSSWTTLIRTADVHRIKVGFIGSENFFECRSISKVAADPRESVKGWQLYKTLKFKLFKFFYIQPKKECYLRPFISIFWFWIGIPKSPYEWPISCIQRCFKFCGEGYKHEMVSFLTGDKHKDLLIINRGAECKSICADNQQRYTKERNQELNLKFAHLTWPTFLKHNFKTFRTSQELQMLVWSHFSKVPWVLDSGVFNSILSFTYPLSDKVT